MFYPPSYFFFSQASATMSKCIQRSKNLHCQLPLARVPPPLPCWTHINTYKLIHLQTTRRRVISRPPVCTVNTAALGALLGSWRAWSAAACLMCVLCLVPTPPSCRDNARSAVFNFRGRPTQTDAERTHTLLGHLFGLDEKADVQ